MEGSKYFTTREGSAGPAMLGTLNTGKGIHTQPCANRGPVVLISSMRNCSRRNDEQRSLPALKTFWIENNQRHGVQLAGFAGHSEKLHFLFTRRLLLASSRQWAPCIHAIRSSSSSSSGKKKNLQLGAAGEERKNSGKNMGDRSLLSNRSHSHTRTRAC